MLQRSSVQELHGDEGAAVLLADLIYRADVWVIQGGSGAGLAPEAIQGLRMPGEFAGQELESDKSLEPRVLGLVDHAHAAVAQLLHDAVMGNGPPDRDLLPVFAIPASHRPRDHFYRWILQELSCPLIGRQQGTDFPLQRLVARACGPQKCVALFGRTVQRRLQDFVNLFPSFGVHRQSRQSVRGRARPWPPSSRELTGGTDDGLRTMETS